LPPNVPKPVASVVRRALTHDVQGRFATAAELQVALDAAMRATQTVTRASDVAAYMSERLATRVLARKEALALAMKSAAERSRIAKVLQTNTEVASGVQRPGAADETLSAAPDGASSELPTMLLTKEASTPQGEGSIGTLASASIDAVDGSRAHRLS